MLENRLNSRFGRATAALAIVAAIFTAACEDNVFDSGGGRTNPPTITSLEGPPRINSGDTLEIEVIANGPRPIDSVHVTLTAGTSERDTAIIIGSPSTLLDEVFSIPLPSTLSGTTLDVSVVVADDENSSDPATLTIEIEDSSDPVVLLVDPPSGDTLGIGTNSSYLVRARVSDESGIAQVEIEGFARRGDFDLGTGVIVPRFTEQIVTFPGESSDTLPSDTLVRRILAPLGTGSDLVYIVVTATDLFGNTSADTSYLSVGGPRVEILAPTEGTAFSNTIPVPIPISVLATDSTGVESVTLFLGGVIEREVDLPVTGSDTLRYDLSPLDFAGLVGPMTIRAEARNRQGLVAPSMTITVTFQPEDAAEAFPPTLAAEVSPTTPAGEEPTRREMLDSVQVSIEAQDPSGLAEIGAIVNLELLGAGVSATFERTMSLGSRPMIDTTISIAVQDLYVEAGLDPALADLPDVFDLEVTAFAEDVHGNADSVAINTDLMAVGGFTARLPTGGIISDAVIDTLAGRERLFLSNFTQSRVDVLLLSDSSFLDGGVLAGAQPWGLYISDVVGPADTLIVANSGGTNLSKVPLSISPLRESTTQRVHTPETVIFEFTRELDEQLNPRYTAIFEGYSDRPQFVAQASSGALLYSTVPTPAAQDGTIRIAVKEPGWDEYETRLLFPGGDPADEENPDAFLVLNVDRAMPVATGSGDLIRIVDHLPGFPDSIIDVMGTEEQVFLDAWAAGSDAVKCAGALNAEAVGLQDTTFVAASGDENWIAFGEGATSDEGRIIMFDGTVTEPLDPFCLPTGQSDEIQIVDLIDNAAERVTGIGLNVNGTLGVARGDFAAYFFDRTLRLEGEYTEGINQGGFGAALHPDHATESDGSDLTTLAFVGTAESTVRIIDTYHFFARGEIPIRDPIAGPLRATRPLATDNQGLTCPGDPRCVVVKLFAVTQSAESLQPDGVVIIDVREGDIN